MNKTSSQTSMADLFRFLAQSMRYPDSQWFKGEAGTGPTDDLSDKRKI